MRSATSLNAIPETTIGDGSPTDTDSRKLQYFALLPVRSSVSRKSLPLISDSIIFTPVFSVFRVFLQKTKIVSGCFASLFF